MNKKTQAINSLTDKDLLKLAKARGNLTYRLIKSQLIAWISFCFLLVALLVVIAFTYFKPVPVLVVDKQGQVLANFDWYDTAIRSDEELAIAVKQFVIYKNSVNSQTVKHERIQALNILSKELQEKYLKQEAFAIEEFIKNNNQGYVLVKTIEQVNRTKNTADYLVTGSIVLTAGSRKKESPFELQIGLLIVPKTKNNTLGIIVTNLN